MNNNRQVVTFLHDALILVRYPGIAQVNVHNFKSCLLSENNVFSLLRWLYMKGLDKINLSDKSPNYLPGNEDSTVNILTVDEKFLMKWYFQSGIYSSEETFKGQSQLDAFINLTDYVINILHSDIEVLSVSTVWNVIEKYFANQINFIPLCYNPKKLIRVSHYKPYIENNKNKNGTTENNINDELVRKELKYLIHETESSKSIKSQIKKNQPFMLSKFCKNFKIFETGSSLKNFAKDEKTYNALFAGNKISKFSGLNKVLYAKTKLRYNLLPGYQKIETSSSYSISENIMTQLTNFTTLRDVK